MEIEQKIELLLLQQTQLLGFMINLENTMKKLADINLKSQAELEEVANNIYELRFEPKKLSTTTRKAMTDYPINVVIKTDWVAVRELTKIMPYTYQYLYALLMRMQCEARIAQNLKSKWHREFNSNQLIELFQNHKSFKDKFIFVRED